MFKSQVLDQTHNYCWIDNTQDNYIYETTEKSPQEHFEGNLTITKS